MYMVLLSVITVPSFDSKQMLIDRKAWQRVYAAQIMPQATSARKQEYESRLFFVKDHPWEDNVG